MWPGDALPQRGATNWQVFYATRPAATGANTDWQTYMKPPGASMIYILMLAAGAGGSRVANGNVTQGGGGGGSGGMSRMLIPATLLPDIIYVRPGRGGPGATTASTTGSSGGDSFVSIAPTALTTNYIVRQNGATGPANIQAAGPAGPIGVTGDAPFSSLGLWYSVAGQIGSGGATGANGNGNNFTVGSQGVITTGGTGGGNGTGTGGTMTGAGFFPTLSTGTTGAKAGFQRGAIISPGLKSFPLIFSGGTGGAGVTTAIAAGNGADASYGGGGGGGGSGTNAGSISGNGGNGGDGLIIIGTL